MIRTWANLITTIRALGTAGLIVWTVAVFLDRPAPHWQLVAIIVATVCEILDGVDGKVARKLGEASALGGRYDMEVDSVMLLTLSFALVGTGAAGWWVLVLGGWRYAFWAGQLVIPALRRELPYRWSRRLIAVLVISAAITGLAMDLVALPPIMITVLLIMAAALLTYSFGRDIAGQVRLAPPRTPVPH